MKIYYDNTTGDVLWTNSYSYYLEPSLDRDYEKLRALNQYEKSVISLLVLHDGQYAQDFKEGRLVGVNLETKEPIFEYPNPENPSEPIVPEKPLTTQIAELKKEKDFLEVKLKANSDRTDFLEEVVTELILTVM